MCGVSHGIITTIIAVGQLALVWRVFFRGGDQHVVVEISVQIT